MIHYTSRFLLVLLPLGLVACNLAGPNASEEQLRSGEPSESEVQLRTDQPVYDAGDEVVVRLVNQSSVDVGYNLCTSTLEREESAGWARVDEDRACILPLYVLEAGHTASYTFQPGNLPEGTYRYAARVEMPLGEAKSQEPVVSNTFRVK